jgi:hypothetical protein
MSLIEFDENRPHLGGFNAHYSRRIAPQLDSLEARRQSQVQRLVIAAVVAAVAGLGALWLYISGLTNWAIAPGIVTLLLTIFALYTYAKVKEDVKSVLVTGVCEFFELEHIAKPSGYPLAWFEDLSLIPNHDRKTVEDNIKGTHQEVPLDVVEVNLEERRTRQTKKGTKTHYVTVFRGLLCQLSFMKSFSGRTIIRTDHGAVFNWFQGLGTPGDKVHLEDPRFEDAFEVHSSDQVEARYLLTPTFMERVMELDRHFGGGCTRLAFDRERLLIAIEVRQDLFEGGSIFASAHDPKRIQRIIDEIALLFDIIEILNLQLKTRI